jgi:hypothetical protein
MRSTSCTDPHDKLSGLYGLGTMADLSLPVYALSTIEVYRTFASDVINTTRSLDILEKAEFNFGFGVLSWMFDWSASLTSSCRSHSFPADTN